MRWVWIDRFVTFESGRRAVAVKNVTMAEDHLRDHFPGHPIMPQSLMIEGMAQTAGILVGQARGFCENVILAKIRRARFTGHARPGDQIHYEAGLDSLDDAGAATSGTIRINGRDAGSVDLMFSHVKPGDVPGLPEHNFVFNDEFLRLYESISAQLNGAQP